MMANLTIETPVNKHAEPGFMPPFHSAGTVCQDFGTFHLSLAWLYCGRCFFPAICIETGGCKGGPGSD
jgi:hypothetical protein